MHRNRAWRRKKNYSKARRKKKIANKIHRNNWYKHNGQYIKGKIHCSCLMCSAKTNNRGRWGKPINYKHSDRMMVESMESKKCEYDTYNNTK